MSEAFNPRMLVLARESRGMSQGELARRINVSQSKVAKYEGELLKPAGEDLKRLAACLRYPPEFFYQSDPGHALGSVCTFHRKRQQTPVKTMKTIHARLDILRMQLSNLLRLVELDCEPLFPAMDIDDFSGGPEEIASLLRRTWGIPPGPIGNLVASIEHAGGIVIWCDFGTDKVDAISKRARSCPPLFFVNDKKPGDRIRMTLAHEIGHVVMHSIPAPDQEKQADRFAAEFLMPRDEMRFDFGDHIDLSRLATLKTKWKVSIQALAVRAHELGYITQRQYRSMFTRINMLGWRKSEPVLVPREKACTVSQIVTAHLEDCGLSVKELSKLVVSTEGEFCSQYLSERPLFRIA